MNDGWIVDRSCPNLTDQITVAFRVQAYLLSQLIPKAELRIIEGFGHTLREIDFGSLSEVVIDFMS